MSRDYSRSSLHCEELIVSSGAAHRVQYVGVTHFVHGKWTNEIFEDAEGPDRQQRDRFGSWRSNLLKLGTLYYPACNITGHAGPLLVQAPYLSYSANYAIVPLPAVVASQKTFCLRLTLHHHHCSKA